MMPLAILAVALGVAAAIAVTEREIKEPLDTGPEPEPEPEPEPVGEIVPPKLPRTRHYNEFLNDYENSVYRPQIENAALGNDIPTIMFARLLWQESRFDPTAKSPAGAIGIAQFMPKTAEEWEIDPSDPEQSIDGAAKYLRWLNRRLGDWPRTLGAYNWGIGNVERRGIQRAPRETQNYISDILADSE